MDAHVQPHSLLQNKGLLSLGVQGTEQLCLYLSCNEPAAQGHTKTSYTICATTKKKDRRTQPQTSPFFSGQVQDFPGVKR